MIEQDDNFFFQNNLVLKDDLKARLGEKKVNEMAKKKGFNQARCISELWHYFIKFNKFFNKFIKLKVITTAVVLSVIGVVTAIVEPRPDLGLTQMTEVLLVTAISS